MDTFTDLAFAVLLGVLKNVPQRERFRRAFLKLFRVLAQAFASDPDFRGIATNMVEQ